MPLFTNSMSSVLSSRIIYTPSAFARASLIHLQETGTLQATRAHKSERAGLCSCLFFTVLEGSGRLFYGGREYTLNKDDCVFIDCKKPYRHETDSDDLWKLQWCHFYGPNINAIYNKYQERGGRAAFSSQRATEYQRVLCELYEIADSEDHVRDMHIHEKLSSLLTLLMEDAWNTEGERIQTVQTADIQQVKEYLDASFSERITLDELAARFFINKFYLSALFKERYGITVNQYISQARVTYVKGQLRFTDKTVGEIAAELNMEPEYLSRVFKKIEGISPGRFRKNWRGVDTEN